MPNATPVTTQDITTPGSLYDDPYLAPTTPPLHHGIVTKENPGSLPTEKRKCKYDADDPALIASIDHGRGDDFSVDEQMTDCDDHDDDIWPPRRNPNSEHTNIQQENGPVVNVEGTVAAGPLPLASGPTEESRSRSPARSGKLKSKGGDRVRRHGKQRQ